MNHLVARLGPTARMLLSCDGSTTVLLEALIGERLSVRVSAQGETAADRLSVTVRKALALAPGAWVLERRSCLVTEDHEVVSVNHVVLDERARSRMGTPDVLTPIGLQLRDRRIPQYRVQLTSGVTPWRDGSDDGSTDSAYKEYVIHDADGGCTYVHEHFNPRVIRLIENTQLPAGLAY